MIDTNGAECEWLLQRAAEGDDQARAELFSRYRARLRRMVAIRLDRRIASRVDPSDIVQDALKDAFRRLPAYIAEQPLSFYAWLRQITSDRLTDVYRAHLVADRRSVLKEHPWLSNLNDESVGDLARCMATSTISPSRRAMQSELEARMKEALMELKAHDREILVLRYLEQLSVDEIAEVLGISQTAVTSRQLRALQRLRTRLGDEFTAC